MKLKLCFNVLLFTYLISNLGFFSLDKRTKNRFKKNLLDTYYVGSIWFMSNS